jgi:hypothetical protein
MSVLEDLMGIGHYTPRRQVLRDGRFIKLPGRFDLFVSFEYDPDENNVAQWRRCFEHASKLIFDATHGQMQIGKIVYSVHRSGAESADAWILFKEGLSGHIGGRLGEIQSHMKICQDEKLRPYVIVHELGHYALHLGDEYDGLMGSAPVCTKDASCHACNGI